LEVQEHRGRTRTDNGSEQGVSFRQTRMKRDSRGWNQGLVAMLQLSPKALVCQFRNRNREFEFSSLHHSVRHFSYLSENRSKSARARGFPRTRGTRERLMAALFGGTGR
jgi:hypothetical protein